MATKKKVVKKKAAKKKPGKSLRSMSDWEKELAQMAENETANEKASGVPFVSLKQRKFFMNDAPLGDTIEVVIVDDIRINEYYDSDYDEDNPSTPACFAISRGDPDDMVPHEDSPVPQCETCAECWANEFGSARVGKGKACGNKRKIAMLMSDSEDFTKAGMAFMRLGLNSSLNFGGYKKNVAATLKRPVCALSTEFSYDEDSEQPIIIPTLVSRLDDPTALAAVMERREEAGLVLEQPYDASGYVSKDSKPKRGGNSKAKGKKSGSKKKPVSKKRKSKFGR